MGGGARASPAAECPPAHSPPPSPVKDHVESSLHCYGSVTHHAQTVAGDGTECAEARATGNPQHLHKELLKWKVM